MKFTTDETFRLITLYGEHECLWNVSSKNYKNVNMRRAAECAIVETFGKHGFAVNEFRLKIKNLRCTYNQVCSKKKKSMISGTGADNIYIPSLKWFDIMAPIMKKARAYMETECSVETNFSENLDNKKEEEECTEDDPLSMADSSDQETPPTKIQVRYKLDNLTQAVQLKEECKSCNGNSINEHDAFATYVGATLKQLGTRDALMAQNEIQDILMKYRLNGEYDTHPWNKF